MPRFLCSSILFNFPNKARSFRAIDNRFWCTGFDYVNKLTAIDISSFNRGSTAIEN